jgi:DNA-binding CsgD family transcriptional regulator
VTDRRVVRISPGQQRVLAELLKDAATNQQIAHRLWVTVDTVKTVLGRLYKLTGTADRTALVRAVLSGDVVVTWTCQQCGQDDGGHAQWCPEARRAG